MFHRIGNRSPRSAWLVTICCLLFAGFVTESFLNLGLAQETERDHSDEQNETLLIVAPREFVPALGDYVDYKSTVRPTELVSLQDAIANADGDDDPERLKRYLYDRWKKDSIGFVLLVGDVNLMPVRYMVLDRVTPAAFDYSFYPSDLYYADLAKRDGSFESWNGTSDGFHARYFGEVRGEKNKSDPINYDQIDYLPDVHVGRWPVESVEEVSRLVEKSKLYERTLRAGKSEAIRKAALISVGGWIDTRGTFDGFAKSLAGRWRIQKSYYTDNSRKSQNNPSHATVRRMFNDGVGLLIHAGHGQPTEWDQCFSTSDLKSIANREQLPVVLSAGCSTAYFATLPPYEAYRDVDGKDHVGTNHGEIFREPPAPPHCYQFGANNGTGLGEQLLRGGESGAVAYIGCNTGSQPCGLTLVEGFVESLAKHERPTVGGCWSDAIRHYHRVQNLTELQPNADWYPPSIFFQGMKFMVFGDPSLPMPAAEHKAVR